jgi:hypothetical protein
LIIFFVLSISSVTHSRGPVFILMGKKGTGLFDLLEKKVRKNISLLQM